jgi:UDPglucose 6-dehydrogenase
VKKSLRVIFNPGDTEGRITDAVKLAVGKNFEKFKICYSPEFIALGSVIYNLENPDMILIGQADETVGSELEKTLVSMTVNTPTVLRLTIAEAEIAKIAINSFVTTKISFSNQISEICENFPNTSSVNVLKVTEGLAFPEIIGRSLNLLKRLGFH